MYIFFSPEVGHLGMIANLIRLEISLLQKHPHTCGHRAIGLGSTLASSKRQVLNPVVSCDHHSRLKFLRPPTI